jgi:NADP-dependent 3-hydroxy acid dehydrogenase YdfG
MPSDKPLKGKVAWITGGGSGIGLAAGIELARAGAHVVISGRSAETLKKAEKELKGAGSGEAISLDVADQKGTNRGGALKRLGRRHPGEQRRHQYADRNFYNVSVDAWDQVVAINLSGCSTAAAVLPGCERKDGWISTFSSWAGATAAR